MINPPLLQTTAQLHPAPVLQEEEDEAEDGENEDELPTRRTSHNKPSPAKDVGRSDTLFSSVKKK